MRIQSTFASKVFSATEGVPSPLLPSKMHLEVFARKDRRPWVKSFPSVHTAPNLLLSSKAGSDGQWDNHVSRVNQGSSQ